MEMKTRILLLGILSILYGLSVTDGKYPRTDKYGRMSLNIHTAGTVNTEHAVRNNPEVSAEFGSGRFLPDREKPPGFFLSFLF